MLNQIDFNKIHIFSKVFEEQGITKAADKLHVTPSAVSQALTNLEPEIGVRLFQRIGKKIVPTPAAIEFYKAYQISINGLKGALTELKDESEGLSGKLRIGAPTEFGSRQVVDACSKFFKEKNARFEIQFGLPDQLIKKVVNQDLDFAFCDYGVYLKDYKKLIIHKTVFEEKAALVCSPSFYNNYIGQNHSFDHLSSLPHCDYRPVGKVLNLWYRHHFGKTPKELDLKINAAHVGAMIQCALNGMGLVFIPTHLILEEINKKKLIVITGKKKEYINPIVLIQQVDKVPSRLEKAFISSFDSSNLYS